MTFKDIGTVEGGGLTDPRPSFQTVAIDGYEIVETAAGAVVRPVAPNGPTREVNPAATPLLFANFGRVWRPREWAGNDDPYYRRLIVEFANEWGLLSGEASDALQTWEVEAGWMHVLFRLWHDGLRKNDQAEIDRRCLPNFYADNPQDAPQHVDPHHAALYLAARVNRHLRDASEQADRIRVEVVDGTRFTVQRAGGTLLRTVWMQFAAALESNLDLQACAYCGLWREVIKGSRYCSNSCRQKAARFRKRLALDAYDDGLPIDAVVERIPGASRATVERWIAERMKQGNEAEA